MNDLVYRKQLPTEVGWYWLLPPDNDQDPYIVYVRDYAGRLAIGNSTLSGFRKMEAALWAGPIPEPLMPQQKE